MSKKQSSHKKDNVFLSFYEKKYKQLLIIPFLLLLISFIIIGVTYSQTGDFFYKGISLSGGITVTLLDANLDYVQVGDDLRDDYPGFDIITRRLTDAGTTAGLTVDTNILPESDIADEFVARVLALSPESESSVESIGASLGDAFFKQTAVAVLFAFLFMGVVVFAYFRSIVPSAAVILAAMSNIVVTIAFLNLIEFRLGTAGIAALLMLIGYSVDTDILLTTRLMKEEHGTVFSRLMGAMKTGLTMTVTTLIAATVTFIVAESQVLREIILVVMIGLIIDLINTWIQNAGILRWYLEKNTYSK